MIDTLRDVNTEKAVLGLCLVDGESLHHALSLLKPADFSHPHHQVAYIGMGAMAVAGEPVDPLTLVRWLQKNKSLEQAGGAAYLSDLYDPRSVAGNLEAYARQLRDRTRRRQLILACEETIAAVQDASNDTQGCYALAQEHLLSLAGEADNGNCKHIREIMPAVIQQLERQVQQKGLVGFSTGIDAIDKDTTGVRPGEMWVVGALPGRGKTALAAQIVLANGKAGMPVAVFSLEMSELELGMRFLAAESTISAPKIRNPHRIEREGWQQIGYAAQQLSDWPVWVDPSPTLKIHELIARAQLYIRRFKVRLLVVDYLRLVQAPGEQLRDRVGYVADSLRKLAKQERVAVVLLSQLKRPEGGINQRPTMLDLKESGDIEAHAHVVLLLYMPIGEDGRPKGEEEIIIGKNRNGALGAEPVTFDHRRLQFVPRIPQEAQP